MTLSHYLRQLGLACIETSRNPALLRVLVALLRIAPRTIVQLIGD